MTGKLFGACLLLLFSCLSLPAQQYHPKPDESRPPVLLPWDVQFVTHTGEKPNTRIGFWLEGSDGQLSRYLMSDSSGYCTLGILEASLTYTIRVDGASPLNSPTWQRFMATSDGGRLLVRLAPPGRVNSTPGASGMVVSAASFYKPNREAVQAYQKAVSAMTGGRFDEGEKHLRRAVSLDPKYAAPWNDLGVLLLRKRDFAKAEEPLRHALEADPESPLVLVNLGTALNYLRRFPEAVEPLRKALRLNPGIPNAHMQLGVSLVEIGEYVEAEQELNRAMDNPKAVRYVGQMYLGKLYSFTGRYEQSLAAFEKFLELAPNAGNAGEVRALMDRIRAEMNGQAPFRPN